MSPSFAAAILSVVFRAPAAAAPPSAAGVVIAVQGQPVVVSTGGVERPLVVNEMLAAGAVLKTGKGDRVALKLVGGVDVRVNEGSSLEIVSGGGKEAATLSCDQGQVWVRVLPGRGGAKVRGRIALAVMGFGEADVRVGRSMVVRARSGSVQVLDSSGGRRLGQVLADQMAEVDGEGAMGASEAIPPDDPRWEASISQWAGRPRAPSALDVPGLGPLALERGGPAGVFEVAVAAFTGAPQAKRAGSRRWDALAPLQKLFTGDEVRTGSGESVSLVLPGGGRVKLSERSRAGLERSGTGLRLEVYEGKFEPEPPAR